MTLRFSGTLLRLVDYAREVELDVETIGAALAVMVERHPALHTPLLDGDGAVRGVHQVFVNSEQIEPGLPIDSIAVGSGDTVEIVTALAGG